MTKRERAEVGVTTGVSASVSSPARCRYKTGRCMNPRVVKPNGTLLLLCEYHRCQQNRTKKRSDMKYRQHRAAKRQLERTQGLPRSSLDLPASSPRSSMSIDAIVAPMSPKSKKEKPSDGLDVELATPRLLSKSSSDPDLTVRTETTGASGHRRRYSVSSGLAALRSQSASPTTGADLASAPIPWPSDWVKLLPAEGPATALEWQPGDVELLEYFIL